MLIKKLAKALEIEFRLKNLGFSSRWRIWVLLRKGKIKLIWAPVKKVELQKVEWKKV